MLFYIIYKAYLYLFSFTLHITLYFKRYYTRRAGAEASLYADFADARDYYSYCITGALFIDTIIKLYIFAFDFYCI